MKYFIGNWKMFGVPKSINILKKINYFIKNDDNKKKYLAVIAPPATLIQTFSKIFTKKYISISAQNCYHKDLFSSNTAALSPYMLKQVGASYVIVGHSDNRAEGETYDIIKEKIKYALKNKLKVIFCIGENKNEKKKKLTKTILKKQLQKSLSAHFKSNTIIVAYEPIWSIGTGMIPTNEELIDTIKFIKKTLKNIFKNKSIRVLYGGSVDEENVKNLKSIREIDGFLIGGASKSSKKFIDIIKNYYR